MRRFTRTRVVTTGAEIGESRHGPRHGKLSSQLADGAAARKWDGLIYDAETGELHSPNGWKERRLDQWEAGLPSPFGHTVTHNYPNQSGTYRLVTLGMRKLPLPEIAVDEIPRVLT